MCKKKLSRQISSIYYFHENKKIWIVLTNAMSIFDEKNETYNVLAD